MKTALRISLILNLALLGGLFFLLTNPRKPTIPASSALSAARLPAPTVAASVPPDSADAKPAPFRWNQLASAKDYRTYISNLRAIGCPEPTIEDIVRGDTQRAFAWERSQLGLDSSGAGPWSRSREMPLVASLLGGQTPVGTTSLARNAARPGAGDNSDEVVKTSVPSQDTKMGSSSYPLFLENPNWNALGFTADQQAVIAQVRQQFQNEMGNMNQNPDTQVPNDHPAKSNSSDPAVLARWQKALQTANNQLRDLLGAQGYTAYEQQQYYAWYQPQVVTAGAQGEQLTINPDAFSLK